MENLYIVIAICITIIIVIFLLNRNNKSTKTIKKYDIKQHIKDCKWDYMIINQMSDGSYELEYYDDDCGY